MVDGTEPEMYCPAGMVMVEDSFCMDMYEAARPDSTPVGAGSDESRAVTRKGVMPWMTKDNAVATAACEASGKRLCTAVEWGVACSGPDRTAYSYGDEYEPATCNGIDTFGRQNFHVMATGSFPGCVNEYGAFDMNGNVWEHVAGGDATDVRGGAYNCSDSKAYHKCSYVPGNWQPSALGFRCCSDTLETGVIPETVEAVGDAFVSDVATDLVVGPDVPAAELPPEEICVGPDSGNADSGGGDISQVDVEQTDGLADVEDDVLADATVDISDVATPDLNISDLPDAAQDTVAPSCPSDMVLTVMPGVPAFCMDRYEAARADSTSSSAGTSTLPVSQPGRLPWFGSSVTLASASAACTSAGKRICTQDEWVDSCSGSAGSVYVYGDAFDPAVCNSIDTYCYCDTTCSGVAACPYPHCRVSASPAGDGGPCGANFHVAPTGSFSSCVNEWGALDINGNVWEVVDAGDGRDHFRGGAYNCSDSEALHRCDHDGDWGPSARGFRCCKDAEASAGK